MNNNNYNKPQMLISVFLLVGGLLQTIAAWRTPSRVEEHENVERSWQQFKAEFRMDTLKTSAEEEESRFHIFSRNYHAIIEHNIKFARGQVSYQMGINQFSDRTDDEMGFNRKIDTSFVMKGDSSVVKASRSLSANPASLDWRVVGGVTAVRDQVKTLCPSGDYAYAVIGAIEGGYYKQYKKTVAFSDQYVLDCLSSANYIGGCTWGQAENAFFSFRSINKGCVPTLDDYPSAAGRVNATCNYKESMCTTNAYDYVTPGRQTEDGLLTLLAQNGPLVVKINANRASFRNYASGIYESTTCLNFSPTNHLLLVGYGTDADSGKDFWIVKNSWGTSWGESGYIRMRRNFNNMCGIGNYPSYPKVYTFSN